MRKTGETWRAVETSTKIGESDQGVTVVGDQAYYCCVVSKLNDGVGVMLGHAVVGEEGVQEGTKHPPPRAPYHLGPTSGSPGSSCRGRCLVPGSLAW